MMRNALILAMVGLCLVASPAISQEDEDLEMELFFAPAEPVWRLGLGADLMGASGWSASIRAYYKSSHRRYLPDPESFLEPSIPMLLPAQWLLNARIAWKPVGQPFDPSAGIEAYNLPDQRVRQFAGRTCPPQPHHSGERLDRRIVLLLHGQPD